MTKSVDVDYRGNTKEVQVSDDGYVHVQATLTPMQWLQLDDAFSCAMSKSEAVRMSIHFSTHRILNKESGDASGDGLRTINERLDRLEAEVGERADKSADAGPTQTI